jgi:serine/threonine-protein kinase
MAEVYEAVDENGRQGAIKVLSPPSDGSRALHQRFYRELEVVARLASPYIVRVYDVSSQDEVNPYFVMERLRGFNLATHLRQGRLSLGDTLAMLRPIAQGLEVARAAGVVHRDIKPHNLFCHDGSWKILDFGVAKLIGGEGTLTAGGIVGTPHYMAPEQASDPTGATVTHLADVYGLAAVAYRCLTGRAPFGSASASDPAGLLYQVVNVAPERPSLFVALPGRLDDVLAVAMTKDPSQRFASAVEFVEAFERAAHGPVTIAVPHNAWR